MRTLSSVGAALVMLAGGVGAASASPEGIWELETRDTRIELHLCGEGARLCGTLVWLSDADYNDQYLPYLNTPVTTGVPQTGPNRWKGAMRLLGTDVTGTITQRSENQMSLTACAFIVACKTYQMFRVSP